LKGIPIAVPAFVYRRICPRFSLLITVAEVVKWSGGKLTFIQDTRKLR